MGFRGDERGQSEVIGALLIFAVIVAFIGLNQAFLVPQANEEVEFKHSNDVQRDIVNLRSGTIEAAGSNEPRSRSISLGVDYPSRFIAINPPPATGTIESRESTVEYSAEHSDLDLSEVCGTNDLDTQFLTYKANYNEHRGSVPVNIDNTVAYLDTNTNPPVFNTGQIFVKGREINIVRYTGSIQETSSETTSIDLLPSTTGLARVNTSEESLKITIPTQLDASDWERLVGDEINTAPDGDGVEFEFEDNAVYTVKCTTIGINQEPDVQPSIEREVDDDRANTINPTGEGEIVLVSTENVGQNGKDNVTITLDDRTELSSINITAARLNYYLSAEAGGSEEYPDNVSIEGTSPDHEVGGEFLELDTAVELNPGTETQIELKFKGAERGKNGGNKQGAVQPNDFYVLTLGFSDGSVNTYFIAHRT